MASITPAAHWTLDDDLVDVVGGLTLTEQSGTIAAAAGKVGGARDWEAGDTEYAEVADSPVIRGGNRTHGVTLWMVPESTSGSGVVMQKGWQNTPDANREWVLFFATSTTLRLTISNSGSAFVNLDYTHLAISAGNWYFVCWWYDADLDTFNLQINNGPVQSVSNSLGTYAGNRPLVFGASPSQSLYYDGLLDEVSFYSGDFPNAAQRTYLWNNGAGREHPYSTILAPTDVGAFSVFTTAVTNATDLNTLTLSATAAPYDWSGIAWRGTRGGNPVSNLCQSSCTLISETHAIAAQHCGPIVGDVIYFRDRNGVERSSTVAAAGNVVGDIRWVRFASPPHADLTRYPIGDVNTQKRLHGSGWWCPQHNGGVAYSPLIDFPLGWITHSNFESSSGKPGMWPLTNGSFAISGAAWYQDAHQNWMPYVDQINAVLAPYGESVEVFEWPLDPDRPVFQDVALSMASTRTRGDRRHAY